MIVVVSSISFAIVNPVVAHDGNAEATLDQDQASRETASASMLTPRRDLLARLHPERYLLVRHGTPPPSVVCSLADSVVLWSVSFESVGRQRRMADVRREAPNIRNVESPGFGRRWAQEPQVGRDLHGSCREVERDVEQVGAGAHPATRSVSS
jgi:hypothetical protein